VIVRLAIVAALVVALFVARFVYRWWQARVQADARPVPRLPSSVLGGGAERTWVVFTTPYCATCEPVMRMLRAADPDTPVIKIDVTDRPDLASGFRIARAPTVLLADASGEVTERLVGPEAVTEFLRSRSVPAAAGTG
jgi:thiol-disulfide isomerase/thioredoxin